MEMQDFSCMLHETCIVFVPFHYFLMANRADTLKSCQEALVKKATQRGITISSITQTLGQAPASHDGADSSFLGEAQEVALLLSDVEKKSIRHIEDALAMVRSGIYGTCSSCGKNIPVARMEAIPESTECMKCLRSNAD